MIIRLTDGVRPAITTAGIGATHGMTGVTGVKTAGIAVATGADTTGITAIIEARRSSWISRAEDAFRA